MNNYLPTLKGLQAFEIVYKLNSFTKAAKFLNVQQPAISYQIRKLEEELGVRLFERQNGILIATHFSDTLFQTVSQAFTSVREVSRKIQQDSAKPTLTIATYPGMAAYWLTPKLPDLSKKLDAKTRIVTVVNDSNLFYENADCWIVFGNGNWSGFDARLLLKEEVCPVASPALVETLKFSGREFAETDAVVIELEDPENRWLKWSDWFEQIEQKQFLPDQLITVTDHGLALQLAIAGNGIALGWSGVIQDLLADGRLIEVSSRRISSNNGYWILGKKGFFETEIGKLICNVLMKQFSFE